VHTTATTASQRPGAANPKTSRATASATRVIAQNSKAVQPMSCRRFAAVGSQEPRTPSIERNSTIAGTPSRAPARPISASGTQPISVPTAIAANAAGMPIPGTSSAPVSNTSRPIDRSPHSTPTSTPPSRRSDAGTGRIPHVGVSRSSVRDRRSVTLATFSPAPDPSR